MFLLDTDHISIIQRRMQPEFDRLTERFAAYSRQDFFISIVSFHEEVLGWNTYLGRARDAAGVTRAYEMFERILEEFSAAQVLPFDAAAAGQFNSFRVRRIRIATMDLRIAATAVSRNLTLLTRNATDFRQVPELRVEDWTV